MNLPSIPERITRYLDGAMSAQESRQFEADLEKDTTLKKAFIAYSINAYEPPTEKAEQIRSLVKETYTSLEPLQAPTLPWWFHVQMWLQPLSNKLLLSGLILALLAVVVGLRQNLPVGRLMSDYAEPAKCRGLAGDAVSPRVLFEQASDMYCGHEMQSATLDKLQALSAGVDSFCMADYYIAHWFLKNGRYPEAVPAFEACLNARKTIEANQETAESYSALQLNTLLARLGRDKDVAATWQELKLLAPNVKSGSAVDRKIKGLQADLAKYAH